MDDTAYGRLLFVGLMVTIAVFVMGVLYWLAEPARMQAAEEELIAETIEHGRHLYSEQCVACHGPNGEGAPNVGPALNIQTFLKAANDFTIFDVISDGRPGTAMPSYGQEHGGTMNAQDIADLTAFIRMWEATAPEVQPAPSRSPDPASGGVIFSATCFACHGINGEGTAAVPALNSTEMLARYDDDYFGEAIAQGRPSRDMPTWGKVLSPAEIDDVVAYIRSWGRAPAGTAAVLGEDPVEGAALFATTCVVCHGERGIGTGKALPLNRQDYLSAVSDTELFDAISEGQLDQGMPQWGSVLHQAQIGDVVAFIRSWEALEVEPTIQGDVAAGARLYAAGCAACHGIAGESRISSPLQNNAFILESDDETVREVIVSGIPGTSMPPWKGDLSEEDVLDLLALMRSWQEPPAEPPTPMAAPPALAGNVENGEALYAANCAGCHGGQGEGSYASALKPSAAVEEASDAELQQLIANGRSGMSAFGDRLNDDDILDLVTLMRAWQE